MTDALGTQTEDSSPRNIGQIIARNTIFGVGAQLALRVASFIFTILVVRTLGDEKFGQYSIVLAWAGLFSVIGDLGINQYLAREIASKKSASDELFWDTVVLRLILAIIAVTVTVGGAFLLTDYTSDIILGIALFTSTYFFMAVVAPVQSILTGNERVDIISTMSVLAQIIFMVLAGIFLFAGFNFVWLVIANAASMPIIGFLQWRIIRRNRLGPPRFHINPQLWLSVLKAGLPFAAVQLSLSFAFQVDTIFLSRYASDEVVGWYSAAYRLTLSFLTISRSFNDAILPTLAREHTSNPKTVQQWYYTSVRFIVLIALPVAVGGSILSSGIISIFGEDFLPSAIAFSILIWDIPFVTYHAFCGNIATSIKREGAAARIYVSVGILNVILNAYLIPKFGIAAACFATVITDFFGAALFYALLRRELGPGLKLRRLLWIGFAAAVMGIEVVLLRHLNIFLVVAIGGVTYLALIWLLPTLADNERQQLLQLPSQLVRRLRPAPTPRFEMRVAIVVHGFPPTYYAGAERAAERIVHWLAAQQHEVDVFALEQLNAAETRLESRQENGFTVHRFYYNVEEGDKFHNLYDHPAIGDAFRTFLKSKSFDVVHIVSGYLLGGQVIYAARAQGIPVVITLTEYWFMCHRLNLLRPTGELCIGPETDEKCARCLLEEKRRYRQPAEVIPRPIMDSFWSIARHTPLIATSAERIAERRQTLHQALNAADLVISPSRFLINKFQQFGFDTRNYVYIRHGLTVQQAPSAPADQQPAEGLRLGYIGQIKSHKGTDLLIDAVLPLIERGEQVTLDLWGPENETPEFAAQLKRRTAHTPTIRWHGRYSAPQVWDILSSFDMLVVPSRWYENSPTVIAEAYTIGLPVIATNLGGMAELIAHEQSGLLFELNNAADLRAQIERLLHEPDLLETLRAGVPPVKTAEDEVQEIFAQYQKLLAAKS